MKKLYIISGEASGDLHGANLIKALRKKQPDLSIRAWGGDRMEREGATLVKHYKDLAFMGFVEVVANLRTILRNIAFCKEDIQGFNPDAIILIDYPGFNLRIAKFAKQKGFKVLYYISPQIWAWKQSRVHAIRKYVDRVFAILPFEKAFYEKFGVEVDFVGHPLIDAIEEFERNPATLKSISNTSKPILALLPGSRKQEISRMLPIMLEAAERFPQFQPILAGAPSQDENFYRSFIQNDNSIPIVFDQTYSLLSRAELAMVTSGTATLETALFQVPQVVCYKGGTVSVQIARWLIKTEYISLVNLIMNQEVVKELIQQELTVENLAKELNHLLPGETGRETMVAHYQQLKEKLGGVGASELTANLMLKTLGLHTESAS